MTKQQQQQNKQKLSARHAKQFREQRENWPSNNNGYDYGNRKRLLDMEGNNKNRHDKKKLY